MKLASTGLQAGLHKTIADTQAGISQMQAHHAMQRAWGYKKLSRQTKKRIDDIRDHMKSTIHYMAQREVTPQMGRSSLVIGDDVPSQLQNDLQFSKQMVKDLNDLIIASRHAGEDSYRRLIEHIVKDNEQHVADLEAQLNLVKTMGLQNYLAKASKV